MVSIQIKTINGHGPYAYRVEWKGDEQHWEYLGRAGDVDVTNDTYQQSEPSSTGTVSIDTSELTSDAELIIDEFNSEEIRDIIEEVSEEADVLDLVKEATDDEQLISNIESVQQFTTTRPSLIEAAEEQLQEKLGEGVVDVTLTEPENEYQDPMISVDTTDELLTNNAELNAEILNHVTESDAVSKDEQEDVFDAYADAVGAERIVAAKEEASERDALGFVVPSQVRANADKQGETPVTEIPYVGKSTAEDMHPSGDVLSVEDITNMSEREREWVEFPVSQGDYGNQRARGVARGIAEHAGDDAGDALGHALNMMDRRDRDGLIEWSNAENTVGVFDSPPAPETVEAVSDVTNEGGDVVVSSESGSEFTFDGEYFELTEEVADGAGERLRVDDGGTLMVDVGGDVFGVAPIN